MKLKKTKKKKNNITIILLLPNGNLVTIDEVAIVDAVMRLFLHFFSECDYYA